MAKECPVPMMSELHAKSVEFPEVGHAVTGGAFVATWYSLPDLVRPAWLRGLVKLAMLAGAGVYVNHLSNESDSLVKVSESASKTFRGAWSKCPVSNWSQPAQFVVLAGSAIMAFKVIEVIQRAIAQRGRKRKDRGVWFAHTRQGVFLGTIAGAAIYLVLRK